MPSNANIYCHDVPSGLTLTGELYPDGSDTAAATGLTVTEETNRKTTYKLNAGLSGLHRILLKSGSDVMWVGWTPANLDITGNFNACGDRWSAINSDAPVPNTQQIREEIDDYSEKLAFIIQAGVPASSVEPLARTQLANAIEQKLADTHGDGSWEGGGGGDCPTADEIGDELQSRFEGRALIVPSPLAGNAVTIIGGADFTLSVPKPSGADWPDLSEGEWDDIRFGARIAGVETVIGTGDVVTPTGSTAEVEIVFTHDETDQLRDADGENDVCTIWAYKDGNRQVLLHRKLIAVNTVDVGT